MSSPTLSRSERPSWLLALIALPLGVVLASLTGLLDNLPQALLTLFGWLHEPSRLQRLSVSLLSRIALPALLVFAVLRTTRAGDWLAPNRLAIWALCVGNLGLLGMMLHGIYQASQDMPPYLMGTWRDIVHPTVTTAFGAGLGAVVLSTVWHRFLVSNERAMSFVGRAWRER